MYGHETRRDDTLRYEKGAETKHTHKKREKKDTKLYITFDTIAAAAAAVGWGAAAATVKEEEEAGTNDEKSIDNTQRKRGEDRRGERETHKVVLSHPFILGSSARMGG